MAENRPGNPIAHPKVPITQLMLGEFVGTFILVFLGCGAVHADVLMGAQSGIWQIAVVWGLAIMLAIFSVGQISGAHINPAMTLAFTIWRRHPWRQVFPYIVAQVAGAMLAAALLFVLFKGFISAKEVEKGVKRGEPGSIVTAMCYGEYFPSPGGLSNGIGPINMSKWEIRRTRFSEGQACLTELIGTMILAMMVFALTDANNRERPHSNLGPVFIGLTVAALISVIAPLTQAGFNPARDFGPRLFAYFAGWGEVALPGPSRTGWLTVYIISPIAGAVLGGGLYEKLLKRLPNTGTP